MPERRFMTKRTARRDAGGTSGMDAAERAEAAPDIRPGRAAGNFRAARTVGVFCSLPDRPDTAWRRAGAVERRETHRGSRVEGDVMRFCGRPADALRRGLSASPSRDRRRRATVGDRPRDRSRHGVHRRGRRCGRGRGYDKYLSRPDVHAVKVGVCFAHQLVEGGCLRSRTTWRWIIITD